MWSFAFELLVLMFAMASLFDFEIGWIRQEKFDVACALVFGVAASFYLPVWLATGIMVAGIHMRRSTGRRPLYWKAPEPAPKDDQKEEEKKEERKSEKKEAKSETKTPQKSTVVKEEKKTEPEVKPILAELVRGKVCTYMILN